MYRAIKNNDIRRYAAENVGEGGKEGDKKEYSLGDCLPYQKGELK